MRFWHRFTGKYPFWGTFVGEMTAAVCVLIFVVAGLVVAVIALSLAVPANRQAAIDRCNDSAFSARNVLSDEDAAATIAYAKAQAADAIVVGRANTAEAKVLLDPTGSAQQASDFSAFLAAYEAANTQAKSLAQSTAVYIEQIQADQAARNAQPLGHCS